MTHSATPLPQVVALLLAYEAGYLPMCAEDYRQAAAVLKLVCANDSIEDLVRRHTQGGPGFEVIVENEYHQRSGQYLSSSPEAQCAAQVEWSSLRMRLGLRQGDPRRMGT